MNVLLSLLHSSPEYESLRAMLDAGQTAAVSGVSQIARAHWIAALHEDTGRPVVAVCQDEMAASRLAAELTAFLGQPPVTLPSRELTFLDAAGVSVNSAVCSLHGNKLFRNGGLCNPDPELRRLARLKVERTLRIGNFFNAKHYIYWVARDGFEVPLTVKWDEVYDWLADGLNHVWDYIHEQGFSNYAGATVEPKPNEPRGQMFLPTSGHAAGFILGKLRHPEFWGVNPELLQHESMALMNAVMTVGYLCSLNKLKFLHFGSQIKAQFDNDFPPLIGPEGLKETVQMFWALNQIGWKGVLEYDCHMLRAEADIGDQIGCRKVFIRNCAVATEIALALAGRIRQPEPQQSQSAVDLAATMQMCGLDGITGNRR